MKITKSLGIWMDHSEAHLMALTGDSIETTIITSDSSHHNTESTSNSNENIMHNKENHSAASYYKSIGKIIREYDDVILFGPTTAKNELANILKDDHLYEDIKIEIKSSEKMSENQEHAFVKDYFKVH